MDALCRASSLSRTTSSGLSAGRVASLPAAEHLLPAAPHALTNAPSSARGPSLRTRGAAPAPPRAGAARRPRTVCVCAAAGKSGGLGALREAGSKFLSRHDPAAAGMGALCATGYCVLVLGQDTGEALAVGAFATVVAMVANELLFLGGDQDTA